jgi:hypothetical protein
MSVIATNPAFPGVGFGPNDVAVCFYKAGGIFGTAIRWFTRSEKVGHTATYLPRRGQWIEADYKKGVVWRKEERKDRVGYAVVKLPNATAAYAYAHASIGRSYDRRMIARFLTRQGEVKGSEDDNFCSEHTGELLVAGELLPLANSDPSEWAPKQLWTSMVLFPTGRAA